MAKRKTEGQPDYFLEEPEAQSEKRHSKVKAQDIENAVRRLLGGSAGEQELAEELKTLVEKFLEVHQLYKEKKDLLQAEKKRLYFSTFLMLQLFLQIPGIALSPSPEAGILLVWSYLSFFSGGILYEIYKESLNNKTINKNGEEYSKTVWSNTSSKYLTDLDWKEKVHAFLKEEQNKHQEELRILAHNLTIYLSKLGFVGNIDERKISRLVNICKKILLSFPQVTQEIQAQKATHEAQLEAERIARLQAEEETRLAQQAHDEELIRNIEQKRHRLGSDGD